MCLRVRDTFYYCSEALFRYRACRGHIILPGENIEEEEEEEEEEERPSQKKT